MIQVGETGRALHAQRHLTGVSILLAAIKGAGIQGCACIGCACVYMVLWATRQVHA